MNYYNDFLSGESHFIKKQIGSLSSPTILDVGANQGDFVGICLKINPSGKIYAFEPHPRNYEVLVHRYQNIDNVIAIHSAMGGETGSIELFDYEEKDGSSHASVYKDVIEQIHHTKAVSHNVSMTTVDQFVYENQISRIDLLKIDTEGHELSILKGATNSLQQGIIQTIQFEFNEMNILSGTTFKNFLDLLDGYDLYRLLPSEKLPLKEYVPIHHELYGYQNIVALHKS